MLTNFAPKAAPSAAATELTDRLEDDRGFAMETLEAHGVETLPGGGDGDADRRVLRGHRERSGPRLAGSLGVSGRRPRVHAAVSLRRRETVRRDDAERARGRHVGIVLVATGEGETMREAQKRAYDRARNVLMPNCFYRTDIGERWYTDASDRAGGDGDRPQAWGSL